MAVRPSRQRRLAVICGIALFAGAALSAPPVLSGGAAKAAREDAPSAPAIPVLVASVEQRTVPIYRNGLGSVQAFRSVTLTSRVDGQLIELPSNEGQEVKAGDVLARIDPRPYEAALRQMRAQLRSTEAQLSAARANRERALELQKTQAGTRQQVETRQAEVDQLEAMRDSALAEIEKAKLQLEYSTILSPIDGRIGLRLLDVGNMILAIDRAPIATVTQIQPISVVFSLPQEDLNQVVAQMRTGRELKVTAVGRDSREVLEDGVLSTIDNQIDQKTGTFKLKATFTNAKKLLWPGQFVTVRLLLNNRPMSLVVPAPALQRGPEGTFVFVVAEGGIAEMRPVITGQMNDGAVLIESGLAFGERVVVDGQHKLRPGSRVSVVAPQAPAGSPEAFGDLTGTIPAVVAPNR